MFNSISANDDFMNSLMTGEEEIVETNGQHRNRYLDKSKSKSPSSTISNKNIKFSSSPPLSTVQNEKLDSNRRYTMTPGGQPRLASDMVPIPSSSRNMNYGRRLRYNLFGTSAPSSGCVDSNNSNMSSQPPIDSLPEQQISNSVATSVISRTNSLYSSNSTQVPYNPIEFQIEREHMTFDTDQDVPRYKIGIFGRNSSIFTILFVLHLKSEWYYMDGKLKSTDSFRLDPTSDSFISTRPIMNPVDNDENELTLVSLEWIDMSPTHNQHQLKDSEGFVFLLDVTIKDSYEESLSKNFEDQLRIATQYLQTFVKRRIMKNNQQYNFDEFEEPIIFLCYHDEDLYNLREEELSNSSDKRNSIIMSNDDDPQLEESTRSVNIRNAIQKSLTENIPLKLKHTRIYVQESKDHRALGSFIDNSFAFLATEVTCSQYMHAQKSKQGQNSISSFFASSRDGEVSDNLL